MKKVLAIFIAALMTFSLLPAASAQETPEIKNVIYLIPDGGGMEPFFLAEAVKMEGGFEEGVFPNATPVEKGPMSITPYLVGGYTTNCLGDKVTDSAAAGTAMSSGYKTTYGFVGTDENRVPRATLLEAAQYNGKRTGMVTIYEWMNATPAAFSAHNSGRSNYSILSEQIVNQAIDVVLGAGFGEANWGSLAEAENRGYEIINTIDELKAVEAGDRIWGNLVEHMFGYDIKKGDNIPNLAEMTTAAITALDGDSEEGFFLMVEGSKIDGGGHNNSALGMVSDFLAFDEACRVAIEYAKGRDDTLVIIGPDHDTGGMILPENLDNAVAALRKGEEPTDVQWESKAHTGRNGGLFIYKPENVSYPKGISGENAGTIKAYEENVIDIPDLAIYVAEKTGLDLEAVSKALFVDVTDMGEYDAETGLFKFNDGKHTAKANASYLYKEDICVELDGQIAVFSGARFYVPQIALDIINGEKTTKETTLGEKLFSVMDVSMEGTDINSWIAKIRVKNILPSKTYKGEIKFTNPQSFVDMGPIEVEVVGNSEKIIEFKCPQFDIGEGGLEFKYDIVGEDGATSSFSTRFEPAMYAAYTDTPITVDGVIGEEEWENGMVFKCDTLDSVVDIINWKGPRDLSAEFSVMWDEENVYLYVKTTDEVFYTNNTTLPFKNLDSITFGFYEDTDDRFATDENCSTLYEHIEVALIDGEAQARRNRVQKYITAERTSPNQLVEPGEGFEAKAIHSGDNVIYELRISWNKLYGYEYSPLLNDIMGFAFIACDNDGSGRRGYVEYATGLGGSRKVNSFAKMLMLDPNGEKKPAPEEISVIINGEKATFDAEPFNHNGRPMLPVRAIGEKLGATVNWNDEVKTAVISHGENAVEIPTRDYTLSKGGWFFFKEIVNGEDRIVDMHPILRDGRTFVSPRAITEAFGCDVKWDAVSSTVTITK